MTGQAAWDGKSRGSSTGTRIFIRIISVVGPFPAYVLCIFVSLYYAFFDAKGGAALRSFRSHLGRTTTVWHLFRHFFAFGMSLIDRYAFLTGRHRWFRFESFREDVMAQAAAKGVGAILLGAHIGNWEIAGNILPQKLNFPIYCVMLDAEDGDVREMFRKALDARKTTVIPVGPDGLDFVFRVRDALSHNGIVCMHGDRDMGAKGQKHNFLGEDVVFPMGPFAIAAATCAPIVPIMVTKRGLRTYVFKAYAPILFEGITRENRDKYIFTAMERYVGILEQVVKERPYEWFNFYDYWAK
jgi:predicted LPLAT superfamily acyltransferase